MSAIVTSGLAGGLSRILKKPTSAVPDIDNLRRKPADHQLQRRTDDRQHAGAGGRQNATRITKSICRGLATEVGCRKYGDVITPLKPT